MESLFLVISSTIVFFFFLFHGLDLYQKRRLPPGPYALPIIGNLLDIDQLRPHESLAKLAQKHGPFMTLQLGSISIVVASTPDAAREVLQRNDEACSGRVMQDAGMALKHPEASMLWMPANETWRTIRKALNMYLTNQKKLETLIDLRQNVVEGMLGFLQESASKKTAVDIGKLAFAVVLNQLSNTFLSQNVTSYNSDDVGMFKRAVDTATLVHGKFNLADIFPVLKPFDPQNIRHGVKMSHDWLDGCIEGYVSKRLKHREANGPKFDDMLDSLLDYTRDNEANINLIHIKSLLVDLFIAGTDTVSNTTVWAMTELLVNPHMLLRVREEVSQIVGEDGKVNEAKTLDLPYLHAVIKETMRLHSAVPLLAPHKTEKEVRLGDYVVPRNTQILVNSWAMSRDPKYWENPTVFMPERFLENKVEYKGQHFEYIPFGSGRRKCPGIPLAPRMVSLMVASFVYHFDWELPHAKEEMNMDERFGLAMSKATPLVATPIPLG